MVTERRTPPSNIHSHRVRGASGSEEFYDCTDPTCISVENVQEEDSVEERVPLSEYNEMASQLEYYRRRMNNLPLLVEIYAQEM